MLSIERGLESALNHFSTLSHQAGHSVPLELRDSIDRIEQLIQKRKTEIPNTHPYLDRFICPITCNDIEDPSVTPCGHLYESLAIQKWMEQRPYCPECSTQIDKVYPNYPIKSFLKDLQNKDPIPTCASFKQENRKLADGYLRMAQLCIQEGQYQEALELYSKAFLHTNLPEDYAAVPELYGKMGDSKKTILSFLYLSLCQLGEGKIQDAIRTLQRCGDLNLNSLIVGLELSLCHSPEKIEHAMAIASKQQCPQERSFIYKQIIRYDPSQIDAYIELADLSEDVTERKKLLLKAARQKSLLNGMDFAQQAQDVRLAVAYHRLINPSISVEEWSDPSSIQGLPPFPPALQDFLMGDCPIWKGEKAVNTHFVVPLCSHFKIGDTVVPRTWESLNSLVNIASGQRIVIHVGQIPENVSMDKEFRWAVMTQDVLPNSKGKPYKELIELLRKEGYGVPTALDAATGIFWGKQALNMCCFTSETMLDWRCLKTFTFCKEGIQGCHLTVGGLDANGCLHVTNMFQDQHQWVGIAGWKEF